MTGPRLAKSTPTRAAWLSDGSEIVNPLGWKRNQSKLNSAPSGIGQFLELRVHNRKPGRRPTKPPPRRPQPELGCGALESHQVQSHFWSMARMITRRPRFHQTRFPRGWQRESVPLLPNLKPDCQKIEVFAAAKAEHSFKASSSIRKKYSRFADFRLTDCPTCVLLLSVIVLNVSFDLTLAGPQAQPTQDRPLASATSEKYAPSR